MSDITENQKILRLLKKHKIDLDEKKDLSHETFVQFISSLDGKFKEYKQRIELLERSLQISSGEIKEYKHSLDQTKTVAIQNSKMAAIGEMASNISHEINNPLAIIQGYAEVISMTLENETCEDLENPEKKAQLLDQCSHIIGTTKRISKIITGLKRLSNAKSDFALKPENMIDLIEESVSIGLEGLKKAQINFEIHHSPEVENLVLEVPSVELSQVFINLFTNAQQALDTIDDGYKKTFHIDVSKDDEWLKIDFINSGPKIAKEIEDKIFDSFFTTKPVGQGSGIGLNISKKIIEEIGGRLYLDKEYESPKFTVLIPLQKIVSNQKKRDC